MKKVTFICDRSLDNQLNKLEQIADRSSLVNHLVHGYGLNSKLIVLKNVIAKDDEVLSFHSTDYINHLKDLNDVKDIDEHEDNEEEYGLGYDCPLIYGIFDYVSAVVGSSLTAARSLIDGSANIAINWYGGWHHAQRDEARGFCYANDIVCAINLLRQKFQRVLYIDLDIHHGDGVENAFEYSQNVLTFSLHKYEVGFYPGSGAITDVGRGNGKFYSVNVPLKDGIRDEAYTKIFNRLLEVLMQAFHPDTLVVQCGCDSLAGDPLGTFNLTLKGYGNCVKTILSWQKPTLFLGGGGYNITNAARCWTYLTSLILGCNIATDIPDNHFFERYGPGFDLDIAEGNRPDCNSEDDIDNCISIITDNANNIKRACWN
ncbi:histone deacetylase 8-like isoform X2 [Thrips palmi]|uniref:Histone deacetylase 8 n=1 Tax=Thrips palmi TaxID=161013 RepID=A0A6P8YJH5_THRPL|nr:histone deacetylase 8-like isoform X2 [Thrips palmi]